MSGRNGNANGDGRVRGAESPRGKRTSKLGGLIARLRPRTFRAKMALAFSVMFVVMLAAVFVVQLAVTNLAFQRSITVFHRDGSHSDTSAEGYALPDGKGDTHVQLFGGTSSKSNDELIDEFDTLGTVGATDDEFRLDTPQGVMVFTRDAMTDALRFSSIIVFILFGLLSLALIWWLTSRLSRRLSSIAEQTAALDPSDLSARIALDKPRGAEGSHRRWLRRSDKKTLCGADDVIRDGSDGNPADRPSIASSQAEKAHSQSSDRDNSAGYMRLPDKVTGFRELQSLSGGQDRKTVSVHPHDEVTRLGEAINGMLDRIEKASRAERQFVSNASHELRTPIAAIRTSLEAPLSQGRFDASVEPAVRRALAANERGEHLVEALLQLSRIQSGYYGRAEASQAETADLAGIVSECAERYRGQLDAHGMTLEWDGGKDEAESGAAVVAANPALMTLAVDNLIRNAIVHGRDGGVIRVTLAEARATDAASENGQNRRIGRGTSADDVASSRSAVGGESDSNGRHGMLSSHSEDGLEMVTLTIANDTREDLPKDLDELIQPFHRGANSRISATPGVGLGLSIVASAVEACDARLELHSPAPEVFEARVAGLRSEY